MDKVVASEIMLVGSDFNGHAGTDMADFGQVQGGGLEGSKGLKRCT